MCSVANIRGSAAAHNLCLSMRIATAMECATRRWPRMEMHQSKRPLSTWIYIYILCSTLLSLCILHISTPNVLWFHLCKTRCSTQIFLVKIWHTIWIKLNGVQNLFVYSWCNAIKFISKPHLLLSKYVSEFTFLLKSIGMLRSNAKVYVATLVITSPPCLTTIS